MNNPRFHLIYLPSGPGDGMKDRIIDIIETLDPTDVILAAISHPDSVVLELDSEDPLELPYELSQLGF